MKNYNQMEFLTLCISETFEPNAQCIYVRPQYFRNLTKFKFRYFLLTIIVLYETNCSTRYVLSGQNLELSLINNNKKNTLNKQNKLR